MPELTFQNPVFAAYAIAASLMALKLMGQAWITVAQMFKVGGGFLNPEDEAGGLANPKPRPGQLDKHEPVERSRRMQLNDLENIPAFWVVGLLFVLTGPALWLAQVLFYGFVATRAFHFWAYSTAKSHEVRATFFTIGSLIVIAMAVMVLIEALF
jgi:uncharacterized MAPEG superfamily protein